MVTISADVTTPMLQYADSLVKKGLYKSRSEVIRELFRKHMNSQREAEDAFLMSHKALADAWDTEDDAYWESFLKRSTTVTKK